MSKEEMRIERMLDKLEAYRWDIENLMDKLGVDRNYDEEKFEKMYRKELLTEEY